jgi:hypothetical protein
MASPSYVSPIHQPVDGVPARGGGDGDVSVGVLWALIDHRRPISLISVPSGMLVWVARGPRRSRTFDSLDRTVAASTEAKGMSRSLRREGVPDRERQQLIKTLWQRHHGIPDPSAMRY